MNAILRKRFEASVLANDAIEVHIAYLRSGVDAVQAALPVLRDKIDAVGQKLDEKIDKANLERAAGGAALGEKIDKLTRIVMEDRGQHKAVVWLFATVATLASLGTLARTFNWI